MGKKSSVPAPAVPSGFQVSGTACGIKSDPETLDLTLIVSDQPCTAVGVFTQNQVVAAPVQLSRTRVPAEAVRGVIINSGNANACTGKRGWDDAEQMSQWMADHLRCESRHVLVCSTGVIGAFLPMEKLNQGVDQAWNQLDSGSPAMERAARGIMTTDTIPKWSERTVDDPKQKFQVVGIAKGAAMIAPNMATMLAVILTDMPLDQEVADNLLREAVEESFNCITVDGHMSTNDTVLLLSRQGQPQKEGRCLDPIRTAITEVCQELACAIVADAEGGEHCITIDVEGAENRASARDIASSVANSPLVKTAIHGADPNWGRIVSAAGYAGVEFEEKDLTLWLNGTMLYKEGIPLTIDEASLSRKLQSEFEVSIRLSVGDGDGTARLWTCDLTAEYVRLNADYRT